MRNLREAARVQGIVGKSRGNRLFLLKTVKTATSAGYCRVSSLTGIVSATECLTWPCLSSFYFEGIRDNLPPVSTLGGLCFLAFCAERGLSDRTSFSLPGRVAVVTHLEPSPSILLPLRLRGGIAGGSPKARRAGSVDTRFSRRQKSIEAIDSNLFNKDHKYFKYKHTKTFFKAERKFFSVVSVPQCQHCALGQKMSPHHANEALRVAFCASGQCSSPS